MWKSVVGYEDYFEVSDDGLIRSVERFAERNRLGVKQRVCVKSHILAQTPDKKGYMRVRSSIDGKKVTFKVHREVAKAFIPNPDDKEQVDHIDGNKLNNSVSNLRWVTNRENFEHSIVNGLRTGSFAVLDEYRNHSDVVEKRKIATVKRCSKKTYCYNIHGGIIGIYDSASSAARLLHISPYGIRACCAGRLNTFKGMVFSYEEEKQIP